MKGSEERERARERERRLDKVLSGLDELISWAQADEHASLQILDYAGATAHVRRLNALRKARALLSEALPPTQAELRCGRVRAYEVTVQVFAAGGETVTVEATSEDEARELAKRIATDRFKEGCTLSLQEVVVNSIEELK